ALTNSGVAAAARARPRSRDPVGLRLELVLQRLELRRVAARRVRERLREQPVRQPWIAREQRSVQVRADGPADAAALVAAPAVVAEPVHDTSERRRSFVEVRAPRVILEP